MAKKSQTAGEKKSRSLGYQQSYFQNRNDMLQSALDAVFKREDLKAEEYAAKVESLKDVLKGYDRELARLRKLSDDLKVKQLDKNAAAQQWTAGQRNAALRLEYGVLASNNRFLANLRTYGPSAGAKSPSIPGLEDVDVNEAKRTYTSFPTDVNAGLRAFRNKQESTGELAKNPQQVDISMAVMADTYVVERLAELDRGEGDPGDVALYNDIAKKTASGRITGDVAALRSIAADMVLEQITDPVLQGQVARGIKTLEGLSIQKGKGLSDDELSAMVKMGKVPVNVSMPPDYSSLLKDVNKRILELEKGKAATTPEAPKPMTESDLIEAQRDQYFKSFYPGATPDYQVNRMLSNILSGEIDPAIMAMIGDIASAEAKAGRMPAETSFQPLGGEVENVRSLSGIRNFSGKQGPRQPGDILDVDVSVPYSDKARSILSNQGLNQFYGTGMTDAEIQRRADDLFKLGLGLTKVQKDGGEILYTVVPSASLAAFPDSEIVMPTRPQMPPVDLNKLELENVSDELNLINDQVDAAIEELNVTKNKEELEPKIKTFSDLVQRRSDLIQQKAYLIEVRADTLAKKPEKFLYQAAQDLRRAKRNINIEAPKGTPFPERLENQRKLVDTDLRTILTIQEAIDELGDPDGKLNEALEAAQKKLEKDIGAQGYGEGIIQELESSEDIPFTYPLEKRGGEMVPFYRKPGGAADRIEVRKLPQTPEDKDISFKVKAGEEAGRLVDAGQLDTYLQKPVGQSVEQLYKANKAKGNQTDKELLSYIAKEFPRIEDQEIAATTLMGLSYRDAIAGKLG
jgi:hypothetical protein